MRFFKRSSGSSMQGGDGVGRDRSGMRLLPMAGVAVVAMAIGHAANLTGAKAEPGVGEPLTSAPFNAAEQRKMMTDQLRMINDRLSRIESKLSQPLDVRVKEMPPIVLPQANPGDK